MGTELNIVNKHLQFKKVSLIAPSGNYFLHIAAEIDHPLLPFFITTSERKKKLIEHSKKWCGELQKDKDVVSAVVFKAILIPPGKGRFLKEREGKVHIAKFDIAILIEATCLEVIERIRNSNEFRVLESDLRDAASYYHTCTAGNVRRINKVDHNRQGVFLFNYFFADKLEQNIGVWEYTAGWFEQETKLDNSTVLLPTDPKQSQYTIINHCRWDKLSDILPSLIFKPSFRSYVLDNFYANHVAAIPVLYRMA